MRTTGRDELFRRVCEVLVEHGGFRMAWIGWHDPKTRALVPVASAGDERGYLQTIEIFTDDRPAGRGPSGTAFVENRTYVCDATLDDPVTEPWRTEIERGGFRASAALPILERGQAGPRDAERLRDGARVFSEQGGAERAGPTLMCSHGAMSRPVGVENDRRVRAGD